RDAVREHRHGGCENIAVDHRIQPQTQNMGAARQDGERENMTLVLVEKQDGVATVTLNRPEAMNALSRALRDEFCQTMDELAADVDVRAIVVTGAGTRAFTAGLDLKELGS